MIAFVGVAKVRRIERVGFRDFGQPSKFPNDAVAVAPGVEAKESFGIDGVREERIPLCHLDTQVVINSTCYVVSGGVDDGSHDDVLRLDVAKFLLDVVWDSSEMIILLHIVKILLLLFTHILKS